MTTVLPAAARSKLESRMRQVFGLVLGLSHLEVVANYFQQEAVFLPIAASFFYLITLSVLSVIVTALIGKFNNTALVAHAAATLFTLAVLPQLIQPAGSLADSFHHAWVWWAVGPAGFCIAVVGKNFLTASFLPVLSVAWVVTELQIQWSGAPLLYGIQDGLYVFLFAGAVAGLLSLTRDWSDRVDSANQQLAASSIAMARTEAMELEDQRLDALIHDSVLHTMLFAASAQSKSEQLASAKLAGETVAKLETAKAGSPKTSLVTRRALFLALEKLALQSYPGLTLNVEQGDVERVPLEVAQAITEATLQALDNAKNHSGAEHVTLDLEGLEGAGIQARVVDDGIGFKLNRIPRDRIGIQVSILGRMATVVGHAEIDTAPGAGTAVVIRWEK